MKTKEEVREYQREYYKKYRAKNRKRLIEYTKQWKIKNKKRYKVYQRKYNKKYQKLLHKTSIKYRINNSFHSIICKSLNGKKAGRRWEKLVGYTFEDLTQHLERQFNDKMSWDNYGSYWVIDHIKPRSLFKYMTNHDSEFKKCWALDNLQPLEKRANLKKGNKVLQRE